MFLLIPLICSSRNKWEASFRILGSLLLSLHQWWSFIHPQITLTSDLQLLFFSIDSLRRTFSLQMFFSVERKWRGEVRSGAQIQIHHSDRIQLPCSDAQNRCESVFPPNVLRITEVVDEAEADKRRGAAQGKSNDPTTCLVGKKMPGRKFLIDKGA